MTGAVCDPPGVERDNDRTRFSPVRQEVALSDRRLVEWVAQASVGDAFPQPWSWARSPLESVILTLSDLGVMQRPARGTQWPDIVQQATVAAQAWLQANPEPGSPPPDPRPRRL